MDFESPLIDPIEFAQMQRDCDQWKLNHLRGIIPSICQQLLDGRITEYVLPSVISPEQMNQLRTLLPSSQVTFKLHWFPPILSITLECRRPNATCIRITLRLSPSLRDQLLQVNRYRCRRLPSDRSARSISSVHNEQSYINFNILTYFNTQAMVPPIIPKHLSNASEMGRSNNCLQKIQDFVARQDDDKPRRMQVIIGLIKEDKVNLIVSLNNKHALCRQPCRIVYLQSLSLLTFWMAMKVKALCNDLYWNMVGYQITLESKTSPNNSVIFFEMSTFIRALNRNLNLRLITHLVIDIDHDHLLFKLLFFYLKENRSQLDHLVIYIVTGDEARLSQLADYFGPDAVQPARFHYPGIIRPYIKQIFLEDIHQACPKLMMGSNANVASVGSENNAQLEVIMAECLAKNLPVQVMLDRIVLHSDLLNYACHDLYGATPLIVTIVRGTTEQVYRLLVLGADARKAACNQLEPIEWAIVHRREEIFHLLFTHLYAMDETFDILFGHHYLRKFLDTARSSPKHALSASKTRPQLKIDFELILHLLPRMIRKIHFNQMSEHCEGSSGFGSILVLLPSYGSVSYLRKLIVSELSCNVEYDFTVLCLYANVPNSELEPGIECLNSARGQVNVILSTFGADCMFLDNICFIINTGIELAKLQSPIMTLAGHRLVPNQLSTGGNEYEYRLNPLGHRSPMVTVYNLFNRSQAINLIGKDGGELKTAKRLYTDSMYHCIYAMKCFNFSCCTTEEIFNRMSCHNKSEIIKMSVDYLKNINVLKGCREEMTELGKILMDLAIEPHYAKMIIYSVIFRCLDPILTIVCSLSSFNPFQLELESDASRWQENCFEVCQLANNSYSDHLAYVYAFQKWQESSRSSPAHGLGLSAKQSSMFEMIYSLRTRLLGQLRAVGFVKGKGPLSIRNLNTNADNFSLVKAAICGGQPLDHLVLTSQLPESRYFLHPSSVMAHHFAEGADNHRLPSEVLLFDRRYIGGFVSYLHNCTLINPLTVMLFIDENASNPVRFYPAGNEDEGYVRVSSLFELYSEHMGKVFQVRQQLQATIQRRLANMQQAAGEEENHLLRDVAQLISAHDEFLGFVPQPAIGKAPQVMSTYFCSTVIVKK